MTNALSRLLPAPPPVPDQTRFGTVTSTAPLQVRLDGDSAPVPIPTTLVRTLVGNRVTVLVKGAQRILTGVVGGAMADTAGVTRYDHQQGYLIQTDVTASTDLMWTLNVDFNTYSGAASAGTGFLRAQGCHYVAGAAIINTAAISTVGRRDLYAFILNNFLHFWLPPGVRYETAHFQLVSNGGSYNRAIVGLTDAPMPTSGVSRSVVIVPTTLGYKPQLVNSFTNNGDREVFNNTESEIGRGVITVNKPSLITVSGRHVITTTGNAAGRIRAGIVGQPIVDVARVHSYGSALRSLASWTQAFVVPDAGTYTAVIYGRADPGVAVSYLDNWYQMWTT